VTPFELDTAGPRARGKDGGSASEQPGGDTSSISADGVRMLAARCVTATERK
jgi:hypothetical protein